MTAQYKLLQPHYIFNAYLDQGTTVTEGVQIPVGWVPTLQVDPLTTDAVNAFHAAGPRETCWEQLNEFGNENYLITPVKPVTYWIKGFVLPSFSGGFGSGFFEYSGLYWTLTGLGSNLGTYAPIPAV